MQNYPIAVGEPLAVLTTAGDLIAQAKTEQAHALLDDLLASLDPQDDITKLCALALRHRSQTNLPMYRRDLQEDDKQINVFDVILRAVPSVRIVSSSALQVMKDHYGQGFSSFTHLNIGIGKGHFEIALLRELAQLGPDKMPKLIKIVGIDIDNESLRETGEAIEEITRTLFPKTTVIEYTPIFAFAEAITTETWEAIQEHNTDTLGVISAFTLHHIPTQTQRETVLSQVNQCAADLFVLLEPDVNHFTPNLSERVANCWNHFGKIFELIDQKRVSLAEAQAVKYTFFGREIEDILSNEEAKRSEKHEPASHWADRLEKTGFSTHCLANQASIRHLLSDDLLEVSHNLQRRFMTTRYQQVPMVAMFVAY